MKKRGLESWSLPGCSGKRAGNPKICLGSLLQSAWRALSNTSEGNGVKIKNKREKSKCKIRPVNSKLRMSFNVPCALGRVGSITTRVSFTDSRLRVAYTDSHSCIWPKSPCYFSMSHTGPATRLTLPLLLYNSTAPSATVLPSLSSFLEIQRRKVGWRVSLDEDHAAHARSLYFCLRMPPVPPLSAV